MSSDISLVKSVATSLQIVGCLCDLCKVARLLNASLTWSWTWDPLGTKHGNYYSCDWCLLRRESIKKFALAGSIWPERLRIRQEPTSAHKKGDRLRQTRCRRRQSSFLVFGLPHILWLELDAGLLARLTQTMTSAPTPSGQHPAGKTNMFPIWHQYQIVGIKFCPGVWKVLSW